MLADYFSLHQIEFETLAKSIISLGASSIRLFENNNIIAVFPPGVDDVSPCMIVSNAQSQVRMDIYGSLDERWRNTTETLLGMFVSLLTSESEMEGLTVALIEIQDRLVALYELNQAARHTIGITDLLDLLCTEACRLLNASISFTMLQVNQNQSIIRQIKGSELTQEEIIDMTTRYQKDTNYRLCDDCDDLPRGFSNMIMLSIPVRDEVFALLGVANKRIGDFGAPDIKLAHAFCDQIGAQLENALLFEEGLATTRLETEMKLAHNIQLALIPQDFPTAKGIEIFGASIPAYQVGGDFMDAVSLPDHPYAFYLGDIAGKGMSAALLMTMARTIAHSALFNMPYSRPDQVMHRLNIDLQDDFSKIGVFATAFIGIWDFETRTLSFTNAGQSPIIYAPSGHEPELLMAADIPVGIMEKHQYSTQTMTLSSGDVLLVATDGLPEAQDCDKKMFGYEKLKETIHQLRDMSAQEICKGLLNEISKFSADLPQADDQTLIILKVL